MCARRLTCAVRTCAVAWAVAAAVAGAACSDGPSGTSGSSSGSAGDSGGAAAGDDGGGGIAHAGDATWYNTGLGACGVTNDDSQRIAALAIPDFDPSTPDGNPNHNTLCGKTVTVCHDAACVNVAVEDRCPGCKAGDIDLSPTAFQALAPLSAGRIHVTWHFD